MVQFLKRFPFFETNYNKFSENAADNGGSFAGFENFIKEVAQNLHLECYKETELIFHEGDSGFKMYFICKGNSFFNFNFSKFKKVLAGYL